MYKNMVIYITYLQKQVKGYSVLTVSYVHNLQKETGKRKENNIG